MVAVKEGDNYAAELMAEDLAPRSTTQLFGHQEAQQQLLDAFNAGRLHHGWLVTGPKGVGKATLAHKFARFLLATPPAQGGDSLFGDALAPAAPETLDTDDHSPIAARVMAGGHGNVKVLVRGVDEKTKKRQTVIGVNDARAVVHFFSHTASEAGWRIAIIDSVDEMNPNAANALLKILEEPPENSILILISHSPGRLLPTIRSRCQKLALSVLGDAEMSQFLGDKHPELSAKDTIALARLSAGAPGRALVYVAEDALSIYRAMLDILSTMGRLSRVRLLALAEELAPAKAETRFNIFMDLYQDWLGRLIRAHATTRQYVDIIEGDSAVSMRVADGIGGKGLLDMANRVADLRGAAAGLHLDRKLLIMTLFEELNAAIAKSAA